MRPHTPRLKTKIVIPDFLSIYMRKKERES